MIKESIKKHNFIFGVVGNSLKMCFLFSDEENIDCKVISFEVKPIKIQQKRFEFKLVGVSTDDLYHLYKWIMFDEKKDVWLESDESTECWFFHESEIKAEMVDHYGYDNPVEVGHTYIINYDMLECLK